MSAAVMAALNWVELTKVVVRGDPFHCTIEPEKNPAPLINRVNGPVPAAAADGEREETTGKGFEMTPIVFPVPVTGVSVPAGKAPTRPLTETGIDESVAPDLSVRVTTATTPLPIVVAFMPEATPVIAEGPVPQETDLPADVRTGPAATDTEA